MKPISVYDWQSRKRIAFLQNAYNISYTQGANILWTASFDLPYFDEKRVYCQVFNLVDIYDIDSAGDDKYIGLFRIMSYIESFEQNKRSITYTLEHVLNTLLDDVMLGTQTFGGTAQDTTFVINRILSYQTGTPNWIVSGCDYSDKIAYTFEDSNLLSALFSVTKPLLQGYYWSFNTRIFPWVLSLKKVLYETNSEFRYKKNITGIIRSIDAKSLCTRLYIYGKKNEDGVKLSIKNKNNGLEYLDSVLGIKEYGIVSMIIDDDRFEDETALYNYGIELLKKIENPSVTFEIDAQMLYDAADLQVGAVVRVVDETALYPKGGEYWGAMNENQYLIVQQLSKTDLRGAPNSGKVVLGTGTTELGLIVKSFN